MTGSSRRWLLLLAPLAAPWTVLVTPADVGLLFVWGLASAYPPPVHVVALPTYLLSYTQGLPTYLRAWPASVFFYACALASAVWNALAARTAPGNPGGRLLARLPRPGPDATASLLAVAGLVHLLLAVGLLRTRTGQAPLPVGTVLLLAAAWDVAGTDR